MENQPIRNGRMTSVFPLGYLIFSRRVVNELSLEDCVAALRRHVMGDWGSMCSQEASLQSRCVAVCGAVMSYFPLAQGGELLIVTEGNRSGTSVLFKEEYDEFPFAIYHWGYGRFWF